MTFESEGLLIVAIYIWLPPASYVVFSDNSGFLVTLGKIQNWAKRSLQRGLINQIDSCGKFAVL